MPYIVLLLVFVLTGCGAVKPLDERDLTLKKTEFQRLAGWGEDDLKTAVIAIERSCARIVKTSPDRKFAAFEQGGTYESWQKVCSAFAVMDRSDSGALKTYFETYFDPWEASAEGQEEGLFTGYYEASLRGSRTKTSRYRYPLYQRPKDLVMVNLGEFRDDLKGRRIAGRVINGNLKVYEDRSEIVEGRWPHNDKVLVWVDDPVDAFFVQIQGSGVVQLENGKIMRIGYAGQNGHPYYAIGRELIKREQLEKEEVSLQSIRAWLSANPGQAAEIMNTNPSYVFFKEQKQGATGGSGVELTPGRSLAIDRSKIPYGMPIWVDIEEPKEGVGRIQKLMMAQDTGGAIRGAVRGDVYWGYGKQAEAVAGAMKAKGRYWFLLPKQTL